MSSFRRPAASTYEAAEQAAERLVGLGAGGTPAGDDLLVGYLAGYGLIAGRPGSREFCRWPLRTLVAAWGSGPMTSVAIYLEAAADGQVSERLADVA